MQAALDRDGVCVADADGHYSGDTHVVLPRVEVLILLHEAMLTNNSAVEAAIKQSALDAIVSMINTERAGGRAVTADRVEQILRVFQVMK